MHCERVYRIYVVCSSTYIGDDASDTLFLNMLNEFRIEKGESTEFILVQVHHKDFVSRGQIRFFRGKLPVKIAHIFAVALEFQEKKHIVR